MHNGRTREFLVAIGLSLLLHAGTAFVGTRVGLGGSSAHGEGWLNQTNFEAPITIEFQPPVVEPPEAENARVEPAPEPPEPEPRVILGISGGAAASESWLGFRPEEATEHEATLASVDQPALEHNPGEPGAPGGGPPVPREVTPTSKADASVERSEVATPVFLMTVEDLERLEAAMRMPESVGPPMPPMEPTLEGDGPSIESGAERRGVVSPLDGKGQDQRNQEEMAGTVGAPGTSLMQEPSSNVQPPLAPAPERLVPTDTAPVRDAGPARGSGADGPAEKSVKQADPTSRKKPTKVRPGRPAAAEGLELITQRPVFTTLTTVTAWPSDPVVKLVFNRSGRVVKAAIVVSSGNMDVDGPVLNALYQWTARGERLLELDPRDPKSGVEVTIQIVLH